MTRDLGLLTHVDAALLNSQGTTSFQFEHATPYLDTADSLRLYAVMHRSGDRLDVLLSDHVITGSDNPELSFDDLARTTSLRPTCLSEPLPLGAVHIPKPWGQEIWYSGIEERGVSTAGEVPLPWLTDVFADYLQCPRSPLLLKTLDPFPDNNLGDLYFEMHEKKVEVYVVTHVDPDAWPEGTGAIRYGFDEKVQAEYGDREIFLAEYLRSVDNYRQVRVEIDRRIGDLMRERQLSQPLSPADYNDLLLKLPRELKEEESHLRQAMYRFTAMRTLRVGDVVTVHPYFPHSLQHGVRVIEFQTPHYERFILSFGQEVLTQGHWDTQAATGKVITNQPAPESSRQVTAGHDVIADFEEFRVHRLTLAPGESIETMHAGYTIVTGVTGELSLDRTIVRPEQAYLVRPRSVHQFTNTGPDTGVALIAEELP